MEPKHIAYNKPIQIALLILLIVGCVASLKGLAFGKMGKGSALDKPTIVVYGTGEVYASPDVAMVSFEVRKESKTVADAQDQVNKIMADVKAGLIAKGIEEKDIKTQYYSTYPVYDYVQTPAVSCSPSYCPPSGQNQVLRGYEVSQSIEVKIRNIDTSGDIISLLGTKSVTNISGLNFTIDNEDAVKATARQQAIDEAKAKAEALADQLGVKLVRIVNFNEDISPAYPMMYARGGAMDAVKLESAVGNPAVLPTGENKIISNVSIVYEIR